jgi:hypothetical protein
MSLSSRVKNFGRTVNVAFRHLHNFSTCAFRRFALFISPLYPKLKWIAEWCILPLAIGVLSAFLVEAFAPQVLEKPKTFIIAHLTTILLSAEAYLIVFLLAWVGHREHRLRKAFRICTSAENLSYADMKFRIAHPQDSELKKYQSLRPFFGKYFRRKVKQFEDTISTDEDAGIEYSEEDLEEIIRASQGFLLIDAPLAGKTMTLFQILRRLTGYTIVSPHGSENLPDEETFRLLNGRKVVVLIDDLSSFPADYDFQCLVERIAKVTRNRYGIAGTCRGGCRLQRNCDGSRKPQSVL